MGIAPDFVLLSAIGATLMLDRAIASRRPRWAVAKKGIHMVTPPAVLRAVARHHRIKWIGAAEFANLIRTEPDLVIFRLSDDVLPEDEHSRPPGVVTVTVGQLAKAIPWIPRESRIVIYRVEGIDTGFAREVATVLHGRDALFFSGNARCVAEAQGSARPEAADLRGELQQN